MKKALFTLALIPLSFVVNSQPVPRVTATDVTKAKTHPGCSKGALTENSNPMPENSSQEKRLADYMRQFRSYRDNTDHSPIMVIHINRESVKSEARVREVTPSYFHIETIRSAKGNSSYCFDYAHITQVKYDGGATLHVYIKLK